MSVFVVDNVEFLTTAEQQQKEGYKWAYVGKNYPSGTPALTIKNDNEEYILFRLEK
jgi:hypothetical protein